MKLLKPAPSDDDLLVRRAGDGISLVVERGDGDPVRVPKGETHRYVPESRLREAVEAERERIVELVRRSR